MTTSYFQFRENAAHAPTVPCSLLPPLKPVRSFQFDYARIPLPLLGFKRVYMRDPSGRLLCIDADSGQTLWQVRAESPRSISGPSLLCSGVEDGIVLREASSGKIVGTIDVRTPYESVLCNGILVGRDFIEETKQRCVAAVSIAERRELWRVAVAAFLSTTLCAFGKCVVYGLSNGTIAALVLESGEELWRHQVSDLTVFDENETKPGKPLDVLSIWNDRVIVPTLAGVVALSLESGERLWYFEQFRPNGYLYGDEYYLAGGTVLNPETGEIVRAHPHGETLQKSKSLKSTYLAQPFLVSETHFWYAGHPSHILAFNKETGELDWSYRPKKWGSIPTSSYFVTAGGQFFYIDGSLQLHWLREER